MFYLSRKIFSCRAINIKNVIMDKKFFQKITTDERRSTQIFERIFVKNWGVSIIEEK